MDTVEQERYVMWMKRKQTTLRPQQILTPAALVRGRAAAAAATYEYESWEERAFAEDAARGLGEFIWPPRSYTCSFCRREFRSAQALGGHMNVHRRDRARLKQALIPHGCGEMIHREEAELNQTATTITSSESVLSGSSHQLLADHIKKDSSTDELKTGQEKDRVSTRLCMGLSLAEINKCKRFKSANSFILVEPCLVLDSSPPSSDHDTQHHRHGLVIQSKMCLMEADELDLELRLGV